MQKMSFSDDTYFRTIIPQNFEEGINTILLEVKKQLQFSYRNVSLEKFSHVYHSIGWSGWAGRKVQALYMGCWIGVLAVYHVSKAVSAQFYAFTSQNVEDQLRFKLLSKKHFYTVIRDLQETAGWVVLLFNDFRGSYYVQKAQFHKKCYDFFEKDLLKDLLSASLCPDEIKCPIAQETWRAVDNGYYINASGKRFYLNSGVQLWKESLQQNHSFAIPQITTHYATKIEVINQDCLESAQEELKKGAEKVAVLMFASPTEPGGGMLDGNNGQEEDLCRRSDIFGLMWNESHFLSESPLYGLVGVSRAHEKDPDYRNMEQNKMLLIPDVTVFRSGKKKQYKVLDAPFKVGMLVSPALDRPRYERTDEKVRYVREEDEEQLKKVIITQMRASYEKGYDTIILGAFGCGAFYNPPELIADCYKRIIDQHFTKAFKKIVFAILDDAPSAHNPEGNLKPFQARFTSNL